MKTGDSRAKVTSHKLVLRAGRSRSSPKTNRVRLLPNGSCKLGVLPLTAHKIYPENNFSGLPLSQEQELRFTSNFSQLTQSLTQKSRRGTVSLCCLKSLKSPIRAAVDFNSNNTMKYINKLGLTSLIAAAISTAGISAQTDSAGTQNSEALLQLPEYIISANTYAVPRTEVGSTVNTISREELELGQTTFVLDALRELPGVWFRNNGGPGAGATVATRGLPSTSSPIILIDGIEVSDPANGNMFNPGTLFTHSVENIEFLKGAQSALYGADALAGVINIETRKPKDGETEYSLDSGMGSYNTLMASIGVRTQQGALDFSTNISRQTSDGFSARPTNNENDSYRNTNIQAKLSYQLTEIVKLYTSMYLIKSSVESDAWTASTNIDDIEFGNDLSQQFFITSGAKIEINESWDSQISYAFTEIKNESQSANDNYDPNTWAYIDTTYESSKTQGDRHKVQWRNRITINERWDLAAGAQYELEDRRSDPGDRDENSYYADNTFEVNSDLFFTLGGRIDDNSAYGKNETWRSTFSYNLEPMNSRLHGSYGTTFQAPTFLQILGKTAWGVSPNADLKAESGEGWDYGIESTFANGRIICDITGFGNEITDKIDYSGGQYINVANYKSYGVESSVTWQADPNLLLRANYTYTRAEANGSTALLVPKNMLNFSASWSTLEGKLSLRPSVQYVDQRIDYGNAVVKSYTIVNLAGQYALNDQLTVWTRVNNLFNKDYQEINGYNSADFNIMAGLKIDF